MTKFPYTLSMLYKTRSRFEDTKNDLVSKLKKRKKNIIKDEKMQEKIFALNRKIKQLQKRKQKRKQRILQLICKCKELKESFAQILESDQTIIDINAQIKDYDVMIQCQDDYIQQLSIQLGYKFEIL